MALCAIGVALFTAMYAQSVVFRWAVTIVIIVCVAAHGGRGFDAIELLLHYDMISKKGS